MENKYITVAYKLYAMIEGNKELLEEAPAEHPFQFITGMGYTLERFEKEIAGLTSGDNFNFTIPCAEAYGERNEADVHVMQKSQFYVNGKFDEDNIFEGNIIMLNDQEGNQFYANVGEVTEDKVVIDLNHPHAGKDLIFEGKVIEHRDATAQEMQDIINAMSGGCGCGGGCGEGDCGCGCDGDHEEGSCGCGCGGHCH